mmetsp:Transcript_18548/g.43529  ORF Transcript_18548/g.43529 Transcript_18548/m.43529 type:complete len:362 (-) Transcript_18548:52-1137(-)
MSSIGMDWEWGSTWDWTVEDVCRYIECTGLAQYRQCFEGNNVNGKRLMRVRDSNLREMGIQVFDHQKSLMNVIKEAQDRTNGLYAPSKMASRHAYKEKAMVPPERELSRSTTPLSDCGSSPSPRPSDGSGLKPTPEMERAAAKIQARGRGMIGRKRAKDVKSGKVQPAPKPANNPKAKKAAAAKAPAAPKGPQSDQEKAAAKIQARARGMAGRKRAKGVKDGSVEPLPKPSNNPKAKKGKTSKKMTDEEQAAVKIQTIARGKAGKKRFQDIKEGKIPVPEKPARKPKEAADKPAEPAEAEKPAEADKPAEAEKPAEAAEAETPAEAEKAPETPAEAAAAPEGDPKPEEAAPSETKEEPAAK